MTKGATEFLLPNVDSIKAFRRDNKRKVKLANDVLQIEWELVSAITQISGVHWLVVSHVQTVHEYHREALLLAMSNKPEIGMAIMRLACELTRDLCRIIEKPTNIDLWLEYRDDGGHYRHGKEYRDVFRFSGDQAEKGIQNLYNIFSNHGVHGHLPMTEQLGTALEINGRNYIKVRRDPQTATKAFMLTLMGADLHSVLMLTKLKHAADASADEIREFFGALGRTYMERMNPYHQYAELYRAGNSA